MYFVTLKLHIRFLNCQQEKLVQHKTVNYFPGLDETVGFCKVYHLWVITSKSLEGGLAVA